MDKYTTSACVFHGRAIFFYQAHGNIE